MYTPDLSSLYKVISWHNDSRSNDHKPGESAGIFAVLPADIAKQFPKDGKELEDTSPVHVTVCYIGDFPIHLEHKLESVVRNVCTKIKPFKVKLGSPRKFINDKNQTIIHSPVKSKKLHNFHDILKYALLQNQIQVSNKFPEFKPHITIEYVPENDVSRYKHLKPYGEWVIDSIWLWGLSEPYLIPLGK
jgi:2'-5' RNA ligase